MITVYEPDSEFNRSDQILVPAAVWERFDREHQSGGGWPIFVEIGQPGWQGDVVGRIRPAVPSDRLAADCCRVPSWMWMRLGAPAGADEDCWFSLEARPLPQVGRIVLRAREEITVTGAADPVAMLTAELTGGGGGLSWACLCAGAELPLSCGVFDVIDVISCEGYPVPAACILDCDVDLELVPALDHVDPPRAPTPPPAPTPVLAPEQTTMLPASIVAASAAMARPPSRRTHHGPPGFVPFSGTGRRLCDS